MKPAGPMERGQCLSVILHAGISKSQCESIYQAIKEATSERLIMKHSGTARTSKEVSSRDKGLQTRTWGNIFRARIGFRRCALKLVHWLPSDGRKKGVSKHDCTEVFRKFYCSRLNLKKSPHQTQDQAL